MPPRWLQRCLVCAVAVVCTHGVPIRYERVTASPAYATFMVLPIAAFSSLISPFQVLRHALNVGVAELLRECAQRRAYAPVLQMEYRFIARR